MVIQHYVKYAVRNIITYKRRVKMKEIKGTEGKCPKCNSELLDYDNGELADGGYCEEVFCQTCAWSGQVWYDIKFSAYYEPEEYGGVHET